MINEELWKRYWELAHRMQNGAHQETLLDQQAVDLGMMSATQPPHSPKMLRTGINQVFVEHSALAKLLISKGIITDLEMVTSFIVAMESEIERYERRLSTRLGQKVTLE